MRTRSFSLLVGALAARPAAEDRWTTTGINFEFFLAYGTARGPTSAFSMGQLCHVTHLFPTTFIRDEGAHKNESPERFALHESGERKVPAFRRRRQSA